MNCLYCKKELIISDTQEYVIEFLSDEWITWTAFSIIFIATPLFFAKYLNASQKKYLLYIMSVLLIIEYTGENLKNILNGFWNIQ